MEEKNRYTFTILTEDSPGVLHRIVSVFTKRSYNIESLTVSETEKKGISRFTIVSIIPADKISLLVHQMNRFIEVINAAVHIDEELLFKEIAFFRISFENSQGKADIEQLAFKHGANITMVNGKSLVIEKTGTEDEINKMKDAFADKSILNFVRSGRISINKYDGDMIIENDIAA